MASGRVPLYPVPQDEWRRQVYEPNDSQWLRYCDAGFESEEHHEEGRQRWGSGVSHV